MHVHNLNSAISNLKSFGFSGSSAARSFRILTSTIEAVPFPVRARYQLCSACQKSSRAVRGGQPRRLSPHSNLLFSPTFPNLPSRRRVLGPRAPVTLELRRGLGLGHRAPAPGL